jgi:hypothetical protein
MSAIANCFASLPGDAEEVDLSSFERAKELDDATWTKLRKGDEASEAASIAAYYQGAHLQKLQAAYRSDLPIVASKHWGSCVRMVYRACDERFEAAG